MSSLALNAEDYHQLRSLVVEWTWRYDRGDAKSLYELMIDEPYINLGNEHKGRDAIIAWGVKRDSRQGTRRHVLTNFHFRALDPDHVEGTINCVKFASPTPSEDPPLPSWIGEYCDEFVRIDGQWKFASRRWQLLIGETDLDREAEKREMLDVNNN